MVDIIVILILIYAYAAVAYSVYEEKYKI